MGRPLYWHQGLFLQPQHFQCNDLYVKDLLKPVHKMLQTWFWGVCSMELQTASLGNRSFNLLEGEFIFRDHTYAVVSDNALVQPRSFETAWEDGGKTFSIYLGVKKFNELGENVTEVEDFSSIADVTTRFVVEKPPEDIRDMHGKGPEAQIRRMYLALKIFWGTEVDQLGDYELIPVAELERDGEEVILSRHYIFPAVGLSSSVLLYKLVKEIRDQISSRGRQLEAYKQDRGIHTAEFGARDMVYLLALRSLNRYVANLIHLIEAKQVHPWKVYGVLRKLVAELSTFSQNVSATGEFEGGESVVTPYDHVDLWGCFSNIQGLITRLLDEITAGPEYVMQLMFDGTYFATDLAPSVFEGGNRYYLVMETESDPSFVLQSIESIAKLSTREYLPILIARSLPGIRLGHLEMVPQELPRRAGALYFQIDHHSDQWAQVQNGNNLALYWDSAPEDLKIELMVVGRS